MGWWPNSMREKFQWLVSGKKEEHLPPKRLKEFAKCCYILIGKLSADDDPDDDSEDEVDE